MAKDFVSKDVRLRDVTKQHAQEAFEAMEEILDRRGLTDTEWFELWEYYQAFASNVLLRVGEFSPDVGYNQQNGHY